MRKIELTKIAKWIGSFDRIGRSATGIAVDSRKVKPGDLFFALQGGRVDGHLFLEEAKRRGAVAAVVSKKSSTLPSLRVSDPLFALQEAARKYREETSKAPIIAITGSVGKTTVKEFAKTLLGSRFRLHATRGNQNSQIGLPLTLFELESEVDWLLLEMSMSGPGQIRRLVEIAPPDIALITRVALTHSASFSSLEEIAEAKSEIFSHPATKQRFVGPGPCLKASVGVTFSLDRGVLTLFEEQERALDIEWPIIGRHNCDNFCMAAQLARVAGMEWKEIGAAAARIVLPPMRFERLCKRGVVVINDSYNACEASMRAALESLPDVPGRKIALLGEMGELGSFSKECHQRVGESALDAVDELICFGKEALPMCDVWRASGRRVTYVERRADLLHLLRERSRPGDLLLVKGSRSCDFGRLVEEF